MDNILHKKLPINSHFNAEVNNFEHMIMRISDNLIKSISLISYAPVIFDRPRYNLRPGEL